MSPNVGNFVHDLVEMAKATEQLPILEEQVRVLNEQHIKDGETIAQRELRIMDLERQNTELTQKLRSVEAERDDAGFRLLEAEERVASAVASLGSLQTALGQALATLTQDGKAEFIRVSRDESGAFTSYKAEEARKAEEAKRSQSATAFEPHDYKEPVDVRVTHPDGKVEHGQVQSDGTFVPQGESALPSGSSGESAERPTPIGDASIGSDAPMTEESIGSVGSAENSSINLQPYHGKLYDDYPGYVRLDEWLAGGGTEEAYHWRRGNPLPEGFVQDWQGNIQYKAA